MKRVLVLAAGCALSVLLISASPQAALARRDKDCDNFVSQRAAQIFYLKHGGPRSDPDDLDADSDGIACEDNPCPCYFRKRLPARPNLDGVALPGPDVIGSSSGMRQSISLTVGTR